MTKSKLAEELGISPKTLRDLEKRGMPVSSVSAAKTWRMADSKRPGRRGPKPQADGTLAKRAETPLTSVRTASETKTPLKSSKMVPLDDLDEDAAPNTLERLRVRIARQTQMADDTQQRFQRAMTEDDIQAAKMAGETNNATQKTLIMLETEYHRRLMESGHDPGRWSRRGNGSSRSSGRFGRPIEAPEGELFVKMNPENPPVALFAFREWKKKLFETIAKGELRA